MSLKGAEAGVPLGLLENFLRQLSHDVRNDLNAIDLFACMVAEDLSGESALEDLKQLRDSVRFGAGRMGWLGKVLGRPEPSLVAYGGMDFFEDWKGALAAKKPEAAGRCVFEREDFSGEVVVDPQMAFEALNELVGNAVAFSAEDSEVRVVFGEESGAGSVRIFQRCAVRPRGMEGWGRDPFLSTRRGYYGLGLFRARRVLEAMGAVLGFWFDEAGKGLVSSVSFEGRLQ